MVYAENGQKKGENGIYHAMLRGINRQQVFKDREDYEIFLSVLNDVKLISGFKLYAYCLMGNHMYGHYHGSTHTFHIWYGGVLNY